ncbi:MAG TPA: glycosyltransferase, partial [Terrimesophilobacter sp.]|nr:glycosyltransferase [Terrimesophilobacter sp.]
ATRAWGSRYRRDQHGLWVRPRFVMPGVELPVIRNSDRTRSHVARLLDDERVDVVHVQSEFGLSHAAMDAAAAAGIRVVPTVHTFYWTSDDNWHAFLGPLARWLLRRLTKAKIARSRLAEKPVDSVLRNLTLATAKRADAVVSPSAHQARDLETAGVSAPVHVIRNPIATEATAPRPLGVQSLREPRFLWAARCDLVKRPLVFAQGAIDALERTGGGFSVDFVGTGGQLRKLRRLVASHPQLRVHGAVPHSQLLELVDASVALVLSSLGFDNQPMTIAEAVSRHRGVLYCDANLREGLTEAGYLTPTPDAKGFADALVNLVENPTELTRLSAGAAQEAAEFSGDAYVRRIRSVYKPT